MLKTIFIGSKNDFNEMLVHWLSRHSELVGVVWTQSSAWQRSWKGRIQFTRKRLKRYGVLSTVNETLFYFYFHLTQSRQVNWKIDQKLIQPYWAEYDRTKWNGDSVFTLDVNSPEVHKFVEDRKPDVGFTMCIHNYFCKTLRQIPRYGIMLWHEGITPEYRGLYSEFWAVHNLDFDRLGYTLLRMNDDYDAGEIFSQGNAVDINPLRDSPGYIGHKAIFDSLPDVAQLLVALEAGTAQPIVRVQAQDGYYTYPGFSDLIRQKLRLRRIRQSIIPTNDSF